MRLEPRVEKLEATAPDKDLVVTRIELHGFDSDGSLPASSDLIHGRWTPFALPFLRSRPRGTV